MANAPAPEVPTIDHKPHAAFFRQSGWLVIANILGGMMALGVHFLNKRIPDTEYSIFGVLLMVMSCVPALPLQMVFAHQTARALASGQERQLAGKVRLASLGTLGLWLVGALMVFAFHGQIVRGWQMSNPLALYVTVVAVLASLWMPLFVGVLQGRQDFFWVGWATIAMGVARFVVAAALVFGLNGGATCMVAGALAGLSVAAGISMWRTRDLWLVRSERSDMRELLAQIVPLMLGFGVCQFLFTTDTMFAKAFFSGDAMKRYVAAGTLSRALLWLVLPLAAVMFPKLVHSSARGEKTNLFGIVVLGTAVLAICGAVGLCLVGPWVVKLVFRPEDVAETTALLPWYAGAMIPLALANVMANDLLARSRFRVVPFMIVVGVGYGFTLPYMLNRFPGRMEVPLQTLGAFSLILLGVCAWFTWGARGKA